ncbi:MAG: hypothetical protein ACKPKO_44770, partial [Candidatus Fonsibacter sp.]
MSYQIINKLINIFDPELSHSLAIFFLKHFFWSNRADEDDAILSVKVFGKEFKNPIGLAAGFDKNADVYEKFCSWYIELSKNILYSEDEKAKIIRATMLKYCFRKIV